MKIGEMNWNSTDKKQIRKFGLIALIFFGCLSLLGFWTKKPLPAYLFAFLALLGVGFITIPLRLKPIYNVWLAIAHFLGKTLTILVLTLAYYLVISPSALLKRIFGGSPIPVKPDKKVSSYWVDRKEPSQPRERFAKRY